MKPATVDETILREPFERGVRLVALSLVEQAQKAADDLISHSADLRNAIAEGDEALHDFRVSIRRLRSWIGAFKPWLSDDVSRKRRKNLSDVADATRKTRDAAAHLQWLRQERSALSARQRVGQNWLTEQLGSDRNDGCDEALASAANFATVASALTGKLEFYRAPVRQTEDGERFGAVYAEQLLQQSEKLRKRLKRVHEFTDVTEAHRARIAAKNLRYVAEPVAPLVYGGDAMIDTLKKLQDSLGDLHDVHMFAEELIAAAEKTAATRARRVSEVVLTNDTEESEDDRVRRARARDPGPGLLGLARRLHDRGTQSFAELDRDWLNKRGADFFERVERLAADIARRSSSSEDSESGSATAYPGVELPDRLEDVVNEEVAAESSNGASAHSTPAWVRPKPEGGRESTEVRATL